MGEFATSTKIIVTLLLVCIVVASVFTVLNYATALRKQQYEDNLLALNAAASQYADVVSASEQLTTTSVILMLKDLAPKASSWSITIYNKSSTGTTYTTTASAISALKTIGYGRKWALSSLSVTTTSITLELKSGV